MAKRSKQPTVEQERDPKVTVVVGAPSTGKTYYLLKLYAILAQHKPVLIFDASNEKKYQEYPFVTAAEIRAGLMPGIYRFYTGDSLRAYTFFKTYCTNMVISFEDATSYIDPNIPRELKSFISIRRQKNLDLFFVFHTLRLVPPTIAGLCNYLVLKKTGDSIKNLNNLDKLPNPTFVINAWQQVMNSANPYEQITVQVN